MNYKKLGDYINEKVEFNEENKYDLLQGVSNNKYFQKAKTNTIGVDLSKYRVAHYNQFVFNRATTRNGDKISIALRKGESCIVSPSYRIFEVKDENILNPDYLLMWFKRPEFDRYARFKSHGSAHEFFDMDAMNEVDLPIPSIEKQREIVAQYQAIENKIKVNEQICEKLEATAKTVYKQWFVDFEFPNEEGQLYKSSGGAMAFNDELEKEIPEGWEVKSLKQIGKVITGKTPSSSNPEDFGKEFQFVTPSDFIGKKVIIHSSRKLSLIGKTRLENKINPKNTVLVTCIGSDMGKVSLCYDDCITNQQINSLIGNKEYYSEYLYYKLTEAKEVLKSIAVGGSTMPMLSKSQFELIEILMPKDELLKQFTNSVSSITNNYSNYLNQNQKLTQLQSLLLSRLATLEGN